MSITTGTVTARGGFGIIAAGWGTDITIRADNVFASGDLAIEAANSGTGATSVIVSGAVTSDADVGIYALARTDTTISVVDVSAYSTGISASSGTGVLSINTTGTVSSATATGIEASSPGSSGTIDVVNVSGALLGIYGAASGSGPLALTVRGTVTGYGTFGVRLDGPNRTSLTVTSGGIVQGNTSGVYASLIEPIEITNAGIIRNLSDVSSDRAIETIVGAASIVNTGLVRGTLDLGDAGNSFTNSVGATWDTSGGSNDFGTSAANIVANTGTIIAANGSNTDPVQVTQFNNLGTFSNAGVLTMSNGRAGDTTVISGTYVSNGGSLLLDTVLGADGSVSDRLQVGSVVLGTGVSNIFVTNIGGLGAQTTGNGIELIGVSGASAAGAFQLGSRVAAGAYEYNLYQGGTGADATNGNWYLRTATDPGPGPGPGPGPSPDPDPKPEPIPTYRREVPVDMAAPALANKFGLAMLGTYNDRVGQDDVAVQSVLVTAQACSSLKQAKSARCAVTSPSYGHETISHAMWARVFGETGSVGYGGNTQRARFDKFIKNGPSYDYDLAGFQAGIDIMRRTNADHSTDVAGIYVGAGRIDSDVKAILGGRAGSMSMDGYSFGAYWTRKGASGWYIDGVVQGTRYSDIRGVADGGQTMRSQGFGFASSLEAGLPIALGSGWAIEPQAQLIYQHVALDDSSDAYGLIKYNDTDTFYGRVGGRLTKDWRLDQNHVVVTWARLNLWHNFGESAKTTFTALDGAHAVTFGSRLGGSWIQAGFGVSGQVTQNISLFATGDYNFSIDRNKGTSFGGRLGARVTW